MSLNLADLQGELREYFSRIEEVLSGMDVVLARLETRVAKLEESAGDSSSASPADLPTHSRLDRLEGQLSALVDSLYDQEPAAIPGPGEIIRNAQP